MSATFEVKPVSGFLPELPVSVLLDEPPLEDPFAESVDPLFWAAVAFVSRPRR